MLQDIRIGARQLLKRPGWAIAVIVVLAVGIGANTTMFSGFEAWVLRPLDFNEPDQLVALSEAQPELGRELIVASPRNLGDWMEQQRTFASIGAYQGFRVNWNDETQPVRLIGTRISASLFPTLGKEPVLGRNFTEAEDPPGEGAKVALISHSLWQERFDSDPQVIGRLVRLDGEIHEIVGVMEAGFKFPAWTQVWTPLALDVHAGERSDRFVNVVARLRSDTTIEAARSDLGAIAERLAADYPETNHGYTVRVVSLRDFFVPKVITVAMTASLASALLVLVIICANVASLMLAQAAARSRETAVRSALGASRAQLVRQSVVEGILLAVPAGWLGAYLGAVGVQSMLEFVPVEPPYLFHMGASAIGGVYTFAISVFAGVVCGLAPVLRSSGARVYDALKSGGRESGGRESRRFRSALVVSELALSTALLIGALLMVKSFLALQAVDPGFRQDGVMTAELSLRGVAENDTEGWVRLAERLVTDLESRPGIERVGVASDLPASPSYRVWGLVARDRTYGLGEDVAATVHRTLGDYFGTLAIPIVSGRDFTELEKRDGGDVVIVSEQLAHTIWGDDDPVGRQLKVTGGEEARWLTVVGLAGNVDIGRDMVSFGEIPGMQLYIPYAASPTTRLALAVYATAPNREIASTMREAFRASAPGVPVGEILTMADSIFRLRWVSSFFSRQLVLYAILAMIVAAVGLYGLTADSVSRRTRELAIRTALGAERASLIRLIVVEAVKLGGFGVAVGVVLSLGVTRFASRMLVDVGARDPLVFSSVTVLLLAVVVVAAFVPARRASALDPIRALRTE